MTLLKRVSLGNLIRKYRSEGRDIVYTDETYVHTSLLTGKCCSIIVHAGSAKGFVPGVLHMYKSTDVKTGDYHDAMNNVNYEKWLRNQLIPNLSSNSVLVVDNDAYHNKDVEHPPNCSTAKPFMINWLQKCNISHNSLLTKIQVYEIIFRRIEDCRIFHLKNCHQH